LLLPAPYPKHTKKRPGDEAFCTAHLPANAAGFSTLRFAQVAGFHRASPSTALDKAMQFLKVYHACAVFVNSR